MGRRGTNKPRFRRVSSSPSLVDFLNGRWGRGTVDSRDASYLVGYKLMLERLAYHPDNEKVLETVLPQLEAAAYELETKVESIIKLDSSSKGFFASRGAEKQIEKIAKFYDELLTLAVSHEKGFEELKHHYQRFHSYINTKITRKNPELARQLLGAYREAYEKIFKARQSVNDKLKTPCANYAEYLHVKRYQESVLKPGQEVLNKQSKAVEEALAKFSPMPVWKKDTHKLGFGENIIPAQGTAAPEIKFDQEAINAAFEKFQAQLQGIQTVQDGQPRSAAAIQADAIFIYNQYLGANSVVADFIRNAEAYQKHQAQVLGAEPLKPATLAFLDEVKKFRNDARKYCGVDLLDSKFEAKPFGLAERAYVHRAMAEVHQKIAQLQSKGATGLKEIADYVSKVQNDPSFKKLLTSRFSAGSNDEALQKTVADYLAQFSSNAFDATLNPNITVNSADVQAAIQQCQRELAVAQKPAERDRAYNKCFALQDGQPVSAAQAFLQQVSAYKQKMDLDSSLPKLDPTILGLYQQVSGYQNAIWNLYFSESWAGKRFDKETKVVADQGSPQINVASTELAETIKRLQQGLVGDEDAAIAAYKAAFGSEGVLGKFIDTVSKAKEELTAKQSITPEIEHVYDRLIKYRDGIAQYYQVNRLNPSSLPTLSNPVSAPEGIDPFKVSKALQILNQEIRNQLAMSASKGTDEEAKLETIQKAINDARADENIKKLLDQTYPSASPDAAYQKEIHDYFASLHQRFTPSAPIAQPLGQLAQNETIKSYQHDANELAQNFKQNMVKLYQDLKESTVSSTEFKKTSEWLVAEHEKQVKALGQEFEKAFDVIVKETAQYGDKGKEAQALFNKSQEALLAQSTQYAQVVKENIKKADEEQKTRERRRLFLIMTRPELFPATDEAARQRIEDEIDRLNDNYLEELDKYNDIRLGPGVQIKMLYTPGNEMDREGHWNPGQYEILVHDDSPESMAALDLAIDLILERKLRSGMARGDLKITLSKIGKNEASAVRLIQRLKARGIPYEITDPRYSAGPKKAALLEKVDAGVKREQIKTETGDYLKALTGVARQQGAKVEANGEIITRYGMKIKVPEIPANVTPNDLFEANKRHESLRATAAVVAAHYPFDGGQDKIMAPFKALQEIDMELRRKVGVNYQELEKEAGELNRTKPQTPEQVARLNALYAALKDMTDTRTITDESATKDTPRTITDARTEILKELGKNFGTRLANLERMDLRGAGAVGFDKPENVDDYAQMLREKMEECLKLSKAAQLLQDEKNRKVAIQGLNIVAASLLEDVKKLEELCKKAGRDPDKLMNAYLGKSSSELKEGLLTALKVVGRILAAPLLAFSSIAEGLEAFILAAPLLSSLISSPLSKADPDAALSEISANAAARAKQTEEQLARQEMRLKVHGPLLKEISEKNLNEQNNLNDLCQQLHLLAPLTAPVLMTAIHEGKVPAFAALLLTQNPETGVYYVSSDGQVLSRAMRLALHKGDEETPGTLAWAKEVYTNADNNDIKLLLNLNPQIKFPADYKYDEKKSLKENIHDLEKTLAKLRQEKRVIEERHLKGLNNAETMQHYSKGILPKGKFIVDTLGSLYQLRDRILRHYKEPQAVTEVRQAIGDFLTLSQFEAYCEMKDDQHAKLAEITSAAELVFEVVQFKQVGIDQTDKSLSPLQIYTSFLTQEVKKLTDHLNENALALAAVRGNAYPFEEREQEAKNTIYTKALREQLSLQVPTVLDRACHEASGYGPTVETMRLVRQQTLERLLSGKGICFNQDIFTKKEFKSTESDLRNAPSSKIEEIELLELTEVDDQLKRIDPDFTQANDIPDGVTKEPTQAAVFAQALKSTVEELKKFYQEFAGTLETPEEKAKFNVSFAGVLRQRITAIANEAYADKDIQEAWKEVLHLASDDKAAVNNAVSTIISLYDPLASLESLEKRFVESLQVVKAEKITTKVMSTLKDSPYNQQKALVVLCDKFNAQAEAAVSAVPSPSDCPSVLHRVCQRETGFEVSGALFDKFASGELGSLRRQLLTASIEGRLEKGSQAQSLNKQLRVDGTKAQKNKAKLAYVEYVKQQYDKVHRLVGGEKLNPEINQAIFGEIEKNRAVLELDDANITELKGSVTKAPEETGALVEAFEGQVKTKVEESQRDSLGDIAKQMVANLDEADCDEALSGLQAFINKKFDEACKHVTGVPPLFELTDKDSFKQTVAAKLLEHSQDQLHYLSGSSIATNDGLPKRLSRRLESQLERDANVLTITVPFDHGLSFSDAADFDLSFNDAVNFSQSVELLMRFAERLQEIECYYQKFTQELGVDAKSFALIIAEHVAKQMRSLRTQLDARADAKQPAPEAEKIRDTFESAGLAKLCVADTKSTPKEAIIAMVEKAKTLYTFDSPDTLLKQLEQIDILQVRGKRSRGFFQLKKLGDGKIGKDDFIAGMFEFNKIVQSASKKLQQLIDADARCKNPQAMKERLDKYIKNQLSKFVLHLKGNLELRKMLTSSEITGGSVSPEQLQQLVDRIQPQPQGKGPRSDGYNQLSSDSDSDEREFSIKGPGNSDL